MNEQAPRWTGPTAVPQPPPPRADPYRLKFSHLSRGVQVLLVSLAVAPLAAGALGVTYAHTQTSHLAGEVSQLRKANNTLAKNQAGDHHTIGQDGVGISTTWERLQPLLAFDGDCSQDFTGPNGPAQYYFPCTSAKPGSTSTG